MQRRTFLAAGSIGIGALAFHVRFPVAFGQDPATPELPPLIRSGILLPLTDSDIAKDRATLVWGDVVQIAESVKTGGHPIQIVARRLEFLNAAHIDSRGPPAMPTYPADSQAGVGASAGQDGRDGGNGGVGPDAGDVLLVADTIIGDIEILSSGGSGGNAQSGGNGARGAAGGPQQVNCQRGPRGGVGGRGGLAGAPGNGGNGGSVSIYVRTQSDNEPDIDVAAGAAGAPAKHGNPGKGGSGGRGGPERKEFERGGGGDR